MWIVRWTLHFEMGALESIAGSLWKVEQQLEARAEMGAFARYLQVAESINRD